MKITKALIKIFRHPTARVLVGLLVVSISVLVFSVKTKYQADTTTSKSWYVSPVGLQTNTGAIGSPWNLTYAFAGAGGSIQPGDTVWLRGGTYKGSFNTSNLAGAAEAPIIIRQYSGERATIDGNLQTGGQYLWLWGFEVMNSATAGRSDSVRKIGVDVRNSGKDVRLINMVIHDAYASGMGFWSSIEGGEAYGNIIYNNGYDGLDHGIYTQNETGEKYIKDNLIFNNASFGIHAYGSSGLLNNINIDGNIIWNSGTLDGSATKGILLGGANPVVDGQVTNNYLYENYATGDGCLRLGYANSLNTSATVTNNYLGCRLPLEILKPFQSLTIKNNIMAGWRFVVSNETNDLSTYFDHGGTNDVDDNTYSVVDSYPPFYAHTGNSSYSLAQWQSLTGFDTNSTSSTSLPANSIFVRPNDYDAERANVAVYNWQQLNSVSLDLSGTVAPGEYYEIRPAQNYFGPLAASGTYQGGSINLPMTGYDVSAPVGAFAKPPSTFPEFGAFVLVKTASAPPSTPPPAVTGSNDTGAYSVSSYQKSLTISGSKASNTRAYYRGTLLADLDTTSWTLTFTPDAGNTTDPIEYKDADGNIITTKPVSITVHKSADINGDNHVNLLDLSLLANSWGAHDPPNTFTDLNSDGDVNLLDLSIMASKWEG